MEKFICAMVDSFSVFTRWRCLTVVAWRLAISAIAELQRAKKAAPQSEDIIDLRFYHTDDSLRLGRPVMLDTEVLCGERAQTVRRPSVTSSKHCIYIAKTRMNMSV